METLTERIKTKIKRCVHCLRATDDSTDDHVFPKHWYPDSTPQHIQRLTAPSCPKCNGTHGELEKDLFIRMIFCVADSEATSGLKARALRSLGLDTEILPGKEKQHREALLKRLRSEFITPAELEGKPGKIPGLGPPEGVESPGSVPIPWAAFRIIAEKIVRGCEFRLDHRFVEPPYGFSMSFQDSEMVFPDDMPLPVQSIDLGPGCRIKRIVAPEDRNVVRYWITIWDTLHLYAAIDFVGYIQELQTTSKTEGLDLSNRPAMRINPYLREYKD